LYVDGPDGAAVWASERTVSVDGPSGQTLVVDHALRAVALGPAPIASSSDTSPWTLQVCPSRS
jgi:hypothetical protein